ncbi:MAG: 3-dehydroquinate synthase [Armatimonadota bacterium]|nr:3-dehydroquinate synthase [Armatimonadota bacterium]MDR5696635.1 3-dehydroquinate synthase [Armatimonadota bacterium]
MRNIVLIGFMGAGKTAVGQEVSRRLGWPFYDTDTLVEQEAGKSTSAIFEQEGEVGFRERERRAVAQVARRRPAVIACGGGVVTDPHNVHRLKRTGRIVLLEAPLERTLARVGAAAQRPLLREDPSRRAAELMEQRRPLYRKAAEIVVDTGELTVEAAAECVIRAAAERERRTIPVALGGGYPVHVGEGILPLVALDLQRIGARRIALLTHPRLLDLYGGRLCMALRAWGLDPHPITVPPGERSKSLRYAQRVYEGMAQARLDRTAALLALGGGVIGDLGAFAAGTYMRGLALVHLPTTLLAQVDSSIGGKAALNVVARNLVGLFWHPQAVVADVATLRSLPPRALRAGLSECAKHAAVADADLFAWLEANVAVVLRRDPTALTELVARNVEIKSRIVEADERETAGGREALNFGHTVAHALEATTAYRLPHGEAVAIGMLAECEIGIRVGITDPDGARRLRALLERAGMKLRPPPFDPDEAIGRMALDKKTRAGRLRFVLLERIGAARTGVEVDVAVVAKALHALLEGSR